MKRALPTHSASAKDAVAPRPKQTNEEQLYAIKAQIYSQGTAVRHFEESVAEHGDRATLMFIWNIVCEENLSVEQGLGLDAFLTNLGELEVNNETLVNVINVIFATAAAAAHGGTAKQWRFMDALLRGIVKSDRFAMMREYLTAADIKGVPHGILLRQRDELEELFREHDATKCHRVWAQWRDRAPIPGALRKHVTVPRPKQTDEEQLRAIKAQIYRQGTAVRHFKESVAEDGDRATLTFIWNIVCEENLSVEQGLGLDAFLTNLGELAINNETLVNVINVIFAAAAAAHGGTVKQTRFMDALLRGIVKSDRFAMMREYLTAADIKGVPSGILLRQRDELDELLCVHDAAKCHRVWTQWRDRAPTPGALRKRATDDTHLAMAVAMLTKRLMANKEMRKVARIMPAALFSELIAVNHTEMKWDSADWVIEKFNVPSVVYDTAALEAWIRAQPSAARRTLAGGIVSALQYVSWDTFKTRFVIVMQNVIAELRKRRAEQPTLTLLLFNVDHLSKSSGWLTGLVWSKLCANVDFVVSDLTAGCDTLRLMLTNLEHKAPPLCRVDVVYIDDMVYSAQQFLSLVSLDGVSPLLTLEPRVDIDAAKVPAYTDALARIEKTIFLGIPYIAARADHNLDIASKLSDARIVKMSGAVIVESLNTRVAAPIAAFKSVEKGDETFCANLHAALKNARKPMIIFEHKIADSASINEDLAVRGIQSVGLPPLISNDVQGIEPFYKKLTWRRRTDDSPISKTTEFDAFFHSS